MTLLNAFTLTTFETDNKLSPTVHRRLKLVAKIDEQIRYATDSSYQPTKQTWHKDSEGREQRVTVPTALRASSRKRKHIDSRIDRILRKQMGELKRGRHVFGARFLDLQAGRAPTIFLF